MFESEQEEFFHLNKDKLPEDFASTLEYYFKLKKVFFEVEPEFERIIEKPLTELMFHQYPNLKTVTNPEQKEQMRETNIQLAYRLVRPTFLLLNDQNNKVDLLSKYPKLEGWKEFYCHPPAPIQMNDHQRNLRLFKTDKEWEEYKEKENIKLKIFHQWEENRKQAFYDIIQPILFQTFPDLQNLEGNYWVIYAVQLRDAYEEWKFFCEHLETVIDFQLPAESWYWDLKDFSKAMKEKGEDYRYMVEEKRDKMIYGSNF